MAASVILLDLDGTLWDSRKWYAEALAGLSNARETEIMARLKSGESVSRIAQSAGVSNAVFARRVSKREFPKLLYEGVGKSIEALNERGVLIGVVSNLAGWLARPLLEVTGLSSHIVTTITPRWGVPAKPSPQGIYKALESMQLCPSRNVWLVGDDLMDAKAAQAAGVCFAWAAYGYIKNEPPDTDKTLCKFDEILT